MCREGIIASGDGPSVDIVNQGHAFDVLQRVAKPVHVQVRRHGFQQNAKDLESQANGADEDQGGDEQGDDRVGEIPVEEQVEEAGDDQGDDTHHIGNNVPEHSLDVDAVSS